MEVSNLDRALRRGYFAKEDDPPVPAPPALARLPCPQIQRRLVASYPILLTVYLALKRWMLGETRYLLPKDIIRYVIFNCGLYRFHLHQRAEALRMERIWCMEQLDINAEQVEVIRSLKRMIRFLQFRHENTFPRMLPGSKFWLRFFIGYDELFEGAFLTRAP